MSQADTIEKLRALEAQSPMWITPAEAGPVIGCNAHAIRLQARDDPSKLGFEVMVVGHRVRIHFDSFRRFVLGRGA